MKAIKLLTICCLVGLSACAPRHHHHTDGGTAACNCGTNSKKECACDSCKDSGKKSCDCGSVSKAAAMTGHSCGSH